MMSKPLISILVPVYNVNLYIERCARSLFEQTYKNIEFIFVNDCTPDNSIDILKTIITSYPEVYDKVKIINHINNKGLSYARNTALQNATGEYIIHIDSDDFIDRNCIKELADKVINDSSIDVVFCNFNFILKGNKSIPYNIPFNDEKNTYICDLLTRKTTTYIWGKLIRRSLLLENSLFSVPGLNQGEDYVLIPRITFYANKIVKVEKALYNYIRYNINSYTQTINNNAINDIIRANQILVDFFNSDTNRSWPIEESKAMNAITLFYSAKPNQYHYIASVYNKLDIRNLKISILHKTILYLAQNKLYYIIYLLSKTRRFYNLVSSKEI